MVFMLCFQFVLCLFGCRFFGHIFTVFVNFSFIFTYLCTVFAANEGVVLVIQLEPARLGSLSFYLPILLLDQEEEEGFEQQLQQQLMQEAD